MEDLGLGLKTVEKRSKGLVSFVNAYGQLAKVPDPKIQEVRLKPFLEDIQRLLVNDLKKGKVVMNIECDENIVIMADPELIEQVLINLIKNAREALNQTSEAKVALKAIDRNGRVIISVEDNGPGIDDETLENIFVPFYTTKTEGSGIGLSLSRQIMRAHKGSLTVNSVVGEGTVFLLRF